MNGTADDGKDPLWQDMEQVQNFYDKHELVKVDFSGFRLVLIGFALSMAHFTDTSWGLALSLCLGYIASTALTFSYIRRKKN